MEEKIILNVFDGEEEETNMECKNCLAKTYDL